MKTPVFLTSDHHLDSKRIYQKNGFALVVTLSLMILLTVIAVGLLSLSSISLRSSSQSDSLSTARANARMALMLAIGELQKSAGPDKRITAPANLIAASAPTGVTGVWKSWRPPSTNPDYIAAKTGANFLGYLMSNPNPAAVPDPKTLPTGASKIQLVGTKSVGSGNAQSEISAPLVPIIGAKSTAASGNFSWVTLDEGMKARIDLLPSKDAAGQGEAVTQVGSAARNGFETVEKMDFLKADKPQLLLSLPKLVSLNQANLGASATNATAPYFHDFSVSSSSLQADAANGGLKTDLSVLFEGNFGDNLTGNYGTRYLYSDTSAPFQGSTSDVKWNVYANYARLYQRSTANDNPKDGIKAALPANYALKTTNDATLGANRYEPDMATVNSPVLMPTVARVDTVFSLVVRDSNRNLSGYPYTLHMMYLPVVTLHNPYNVPLRVTSMQVEFSDIPVGFRFFAGTDWATKTLVPLNDMYLGTNGKAGAAKSFKLSLTNSLSGATEVMMGPGETKIFGTPFAKSTAWTSAGAMSDWKNTTNSVVSPVAPGTITGPNDGVGFDIDWLAPNPADFTDVFRAREAPLLGGTAVGAQVHLKANETIKVEYGPKSPVTANNAFTITVSLGAAVAGKTQVVYDTTTLNAVMGEGKSPRYPDARTFPATYPDKTSAPVDTLKLYETSGTPVSDYVRAKPFAIFSVGAKTTRESFTLCRPVTDTGIVYQMATCDLKTSKTQGGSPLEFSLVPQISSSAIQSGGPKGDLGYSFGGHGTVNGTTAATIYEIPMAPLQSIAQLRHANGGSIGSAPYVTYTVGESRAHPAIPADSVSYKPDSARTMLDHSWLANDQLWDRYWFSTLSTLQGKAYTTSVTLPTVAKEFFEGMRSLPNNRNIVSALGGKTRQEAASAAVATDGRQSAAYIMTQGGFNVNSTSVAAWVSILSGLTDSDVPLTSGTTEKNPAGTPVLRVRQPAAGLSGTTAAKEKLWTGYRTLTAAEIQSLATEIVAEIKTRGPFLSMAEFVNRRLASPGDLSTKGAIQAALDRTTINKAVESNTRPITPADVSSYGWQNPGAVINNTGEGAPGAISQGDILSSIGSFAFVRSDTFRIRTSGSALDPTGKVIAQAWCEATIQRVPEYVDPTDAPSATATAPSNMNFGRQFRVISLRWLNSNEI